MATEFATTNRARAMRSRVKIVTAQFGNRAIVVYLGLCCRAGFWCSRRTPQDTKPTSGRSGPGARIRTARRDERDAFRSFNGVTRDRKRKRRKRNGRRSKDRRHRSELDGCSRSVVARAANARHGHARQRATSARRSRVRKDDSERQYDMGNGADGRQTISPSRH